MIRRPPRSTQSRSSAASDVYKRQGYTIGGVSPIGHLVKIKMFIDENLGRFSKVFAAAGHPNAVFEISYVELKRLTGAEIDDLTE